jgi:hypothetical protein
VIVASVSFGVHPRGKPQDEFPIFPLEPQVIFEGRNRRFRPAWDFLIVSHQSVAKAFTADSYGG